jgi:hypothetical protein
LPQDFFLLAVFAQSHTHGTGNRAGRKKRRFSVQTQVAGIRRRFTSPSGRLIADLMSCAAIAFAARLALTSCGAAAALALAIAQQAAG